MVTPARRLGRIFTCLFAFQFAAALKAQPAAAPVDADLYGDAALRDGFRPAYPRELMKAGVGGVVRARFNVDAAGKLTAFRVVDSPDPRLSALVESAVRAWTFVPAVEKGVPTACGLEAAFYFNPKEKPRGEHELVPEPESPHGAEKTQAQPKETPPGHYPAVLTERLVPGIARFACTVNAEGHAVASQVRAVSHADFVQPTLAALAEWEFTPGMQGDLPVATELQGEMTFDVPVANAAEALAANGITAPDGSTPALAPEIRFLADPVWPIEALLKGEDGSAEVSFTVTERGDVADVTVETASAPEFGQSLTAAVEMWQFARVFADGQAVAVHLRKRAEFKLPEADEPEGRLVAALRDNAVGNARGLDAKLAPLFRMPADYPPALKQGDKPAGTAMIEIVIDREGRARLPRIVSATREEFGWAAATAAAQWVFQPPMRGGHAVDVKVRVPFEFTAPEN